MNSILFLKLFLSACILGDCNDTVQTDYQVCMVSGKECLVSFAQMINEAYKKVLWLCDDVERITPEQLEQFIDHPNQSLYVCCDGKTVCGAIMLDNTDPSGKLEMAMFTVHPDYQGKNIGSLLLKAVEKDAVERYHTHELYLYVIPYTQERLVTYYQHHGFELIEELPFTALHVVKPEYRDQISLYLMRKRV